LSLEVAVPEPEQTPSIHRPVVLRGGTVLTMDDAHTVRTDADVLVVDGKIAAVRPHLDAPPDAFEVDARGGIVMPGMIDTHRHMWQTAMRGYGADWTLTQYFVWYYLEHGRVFRPQDIYAGNLVSAWESLEAGVTTTVDWSHGLQTVDHAEAAVAALQAVPGRFVLAYGNIQQGPWEWSAAPEFRDFVGTPPRTCWPSNSPSTSPATRPSLRRRRSRPPASSACPSPPTRACGAPPTTTASG
jgi:cytosine/adenosine deaminase-related metal-dependent hydrolase